MSEPEVRTAQAGTVESMDCLVTITRVSGGGREIKLAGSSVVRFKSAILHRINETLDSLGASGVEVDVRDNGAIDLVLSARVEAAYRRLVGGEA